MVEVMNRSRRATRVSMETHYEISAFLYEEARLLDTSMLRKWIDEFVSKDIRYRMVIRPERYRRDLPADGSGDLFIYDDGLATMEMRVLQFETGLQKMNEPLARTVRTISNIEAFEGDAEGAYMVRSCGILNRFRREYEQEAIVYVRDDHLARDGSCFRIVARSVELPQRVFAGKNLLIFL